MAGSPSITRTPRSSRARASSTTERLPWWTRFTRRRPRSGATPAPAQSPQQYDLRAIDSRVWPDL